MSDEMSTYRYFHRLLLSAILPAALAAMTVISLTSFRQDYPEFYNFEPLAIGSGFVLAMISFLYNFYRLLSIAKNNTNRKAQMTIKSSLIMVTPFLLLYIGLIVFISFSYSWQAMIGFFGGYIIFPFIVYLYETFSGNKIIIEEVNIDDEKARFFTIRKRW